MQLSLLLLLPLLASAALNGQSTPALALDLKVKPAMVNSPQGIYETHHVKIEGGSPPYKVGAFLNMPEIHATLQSNNEIVITGACTNGEAGRTDQLNVADSAQQQLNVGLYCVEASTEDPIQYKTFVGLQQSQATASDRTFKLFADLGFNFQIRNNTRFFIDLDATSVPQQIGFNVSQVSAQGPAVLKNLHINDAVQSVNLLVGFELFSLFNDSFPKVTIKPVVLGGFSTPLSPKESVAIYASTQDAYNTLGIKVDSSGQPVNTTTYPNLALTTPDRSRFYSQWYGGLRFKIKDPNFKGSSSGTLYPAYFDMTFGQNSAITAGQLRHFVWRFAGFVPVPKLTPLAIFGTAYSVIDKNQDSNPLFLDSPTTPITLPNSMTYVFAKKENRDFYQIGVALDLGWIADISGLTAKLKGK